MNSRTEQIKAFERLLNIMDDLRAKCPWDKKQTLESLRYLTIEEMYELSDAILDDDKQEILDLGKNECAASAYAAQQQAQHIRA